MPNQLDISTDQFSGTKVSLKTGQAVDATNYARFQNLTTLETYLLANGYTQATLDKMTKNDKIMAARQKVGSAIAP